MKGALPWLFRWACRDRTGDFCAAALAALNSVQYKIIVSSPYTISIPFPYRSASWAGNSQPPFAHLCARSPLIN
jgi:hypothetical protein